MPYWFGQTRKKKERVREFIHCKERKKSFSQEGKGGGAEKRIPREGGVFEAKEANGFGFSCHIEVRIAPPSFDSCC